MRFRFIAFYFSNIFVSSAFFMPGDMPSLDAQTTRFNGAPLSYKISRWRLHAKYDSEERMSARQRFAILI